MKQSKKNEYLLLFGRWTSKLGDIVFDYVNNVAIVHSFIHSAWILAIYQSSQTVVNVLFNFIGGAVADRGRRKKIIILADFFSALICFAASFFIDSKYMAEAIIAANALLAFVFSFSSPTFKAIVREMVDSENVSRYNSISNMGKELISMIGPAIGLGLMTFFDARISLLINAATFFVSAMSECFLNPIVIYEPKKEKNNILHDVKDGMVYLWKDRKIFNLVLLSSLVNVFLAGYNLIAPYSDLLFENSFANFYGKLTIAEASGGIVGSFINSRLSNETTKKYGILMLFLFLTGASLFIIPFLFLTGQLVLCLVPFFLFGGFLTMFNINFMSLVQLSVKDEFLGRVFSVIFTVAVLFMPLGSFLFSLLKITKDIDGYLILGTGIMILTGVFALTGKNK